MHPACPCWMQRPFGSVELIILLEGPSPWCSGPVIHLKLLILWSTVRTYSAHTLRLPTNGCASLVSEIRACRGSAYRFALDSMPQPPRQKIRRGFGIRLPRVRLLQCQASPVSELLRLRSARRKSAHMATEQDQRRGCVLFDVALPKKTTRGQHHRLHT